MKFQSICIFLIWLYLPCNTSVTVIRRVYNNIESSTKRSVDYFSNRYQDQKFCLKLNAICNDDCTLCKCEKGKIFISYQDGCQTYTQTIELFQDKNEYITMPENSSFTPLRKELRPDNACNKINSQLISFEKYYTCTVGNFYGINPINSSIVYINNEVANGRNSDILPYTIGPNICLKCYSEYCSLDKYVGMAAIMNIHCLKVADDIPVKFMLIFQITGTFTSDYTIATTSTTIFTTTKTNKVESTTFKGITPFVKQRYYSDRSNKDNYLTISLSAFASFMVLLTILLILALYVRRRRKRKKCRIGHTIITDESIHKYVGSPIYQKIERDGNSIYISSPNPLYGKASRDIYTICIQNESRNVLQRSASKTNGNTMHPSYYLSTVNPLYERHLSRFLSQNNMNLNRPLETFSDPESENVIEERFDENAYLQSTDVMRLFDSFKETYSNEESNHNFYENYTEAQTETSQS